MTEEEHLEWAKERAFMYLDEGDINQAKSSFTSDISKHEALKESISSFLLMMLMTKDSVNETRKFIEGF